MLPTVLTGSPDNPEAVHGMPVSLQIVASRLQEEKAVEMTKVVMQVL